MNSTTQTLTIEQALDVAMSHHRNGNLGQAQSIYGRILSHIPEHAVAMHYLGVLMNQLGQQEQAIRLIRRSIELFPDQPAYYNNLGEVYRLVGQFNEAEEAFRQAIELDAKDAGARNNLGLTYLDQNRLEEAKSMLESSLAIQPSNAGALCNLGATLHRLGHLEEAHDALRRAMLINPALDAAHTNLSSLLATMGRLDEAIQSADTAINLAPDDPQAHLMRANAFFLAGEWTSAWPEYEWRQQLNPQFVRPHPQQRWGGDDLNGRIILIYCEREPRDAILYARFIPLVAGRGGQVVLDCPADLAELLRSVDGIQDVIVTGRMPPAFDVHCPLESLPGIFQTDPQNVPAKVPYLRADERMISIWREKTHATDAKRHVGLEIPLEHALTQHFAAFSIPGVEFFNLAIGQNGVISISDQAAIIANLDLVIAVDSPTAHLAGAMGKSVWNLLSFNNDARWMRERTDTPWYPMMQLFRQTTPNDWDAVAADIERALLELSTT